MANKSTFATLSTIKPRKVQWLWKPFIPFGMLTILEGDPGLGKSFLSMYARFDIRSSFGAIRRKNEFG